MNIDDTVLVIEGPYKGTIGKVARIEGDKYVIVEDGQLFGFYADVNSVEYVNPEYMSEMATVARIPATNKRSALRIEVNPDRKRKGDPYFKVMDTMGYDKKKSRVCRLHFLDSGMEFHTGDGLLTWDITNRDIKEIIKALKMEHEDFPEYTNWQMACYLWNMEYGFDINRQSYFNGEYDDKYKDHPSYVPSTQEIPDTWSKEETE